MLLWKVCLVQNPPEPLRYAPRYSPSDIRLTTKGFCKRISSQELSGGPLVAGDRPETVFSLRSGSAIAVGVIVELWERIIVLSKDLLIHRHV